MPTQGCLDNIKNKTPPRYCSGDYCSQIQGDINEYCHHNGLGGDVPVPQIDSQGKCWCCCSCAAWGTPVEVSEGNYKLIETILPGQTVIATGGKMAGWESYEVTEAGGIAPGTPLDICYYSQFTMADGAMRYMITTADHLFLLPNGRLKPVQDLRPSDVVVQADGGQAAVAFVATGQFSGGVRNFALGNFDPNQYPDDPYKGHLINTFGLVTADLAVQTAFYATAFPPHMVAEETPAPIGSKAFYEQHANEAYHSFVADREQWPTAFTAAPPPLFNIPASALPYFTDDQARALGDLELGNGLGDSQAMANFKYLKWLFSGFYTDLYYAADWANNDVNAWYFNSLDQPYIVLSGGMLRFPNMGIQGLSMVMCHMVANQLGFGCTGEADYQGSAIQFRTIWFDEIYFDQFDAAYAQIKATFAQVPPEYSGEDPNNVCRQPSLECRLKAIKNGQSFSRVPDCAKPPPPFAVIGASAPSLEQVEVDFGAALFAPTATDPANYTISEEITVLQTAYTDGETKVMLTTQPMLPSTGYEVTVKGVMSARGQILAPDHNSAMYKTE